MTCARSAIAPPDQHGCFHVVTRCVRQSFLCGVDAASGRSFEHRRGWVEERIRLLAEIFAVRLHGFAVMSNHTHLIVEFNPAWVARWTDREVAERWLQLYCPANFSALRRQRRIEAWMAKEGKIEELRLRLASVSEFMKALNEYIARLANVEDKAKGHFWEARFKCQRLLDAKAIASAMVYVDLNPIRAKMADALASSAYTSIQARLKAAAEQMGEANLREQLLRPIAGVAGPGPIPITLADYIELVDWSGRQLHPTKRGRIEPGQPPALQRIGLSPRAWKHQVLGTESLYHRAIGEAADLIAYARQVGQQCLLGPGVRDLLKLMRAEQRMA
jgi:REP element-mobilizing transposase RayT